VAILFILSIQMSLSTFSILSERYPTWGALATFLKSEEGGFLRIDDSAVEKRPFALIRYVKGKSNLTLPHVRAFRSVVWDVTKNVPVSIAPLKSIDGESLPTTETTEGFTIEHFIDGVMICGFYDTYNSEWCFHTRSTLNAMCRYYSQTKTFLDMFKAAMSSVVPADGTNVWETFLASLDKTTNYTWVLQHPENRIVVSVATPKAWCVQSLQMSDGAIRHVSTGPFNVLLSVRANTWEQLREMLADAVSMKAHNVLGFVVKQDDRRWKIRSPVYNQVRLMRGNSARRDFLWLSLWRSNTLPAYLSIYPEEITEANAIVNRWKHITSVVYHTYCDVFKVRSMAKNAIEPKYRPFVFGLHNLYINELKPQNKSVDWKTAMQYMNSRDTAQALYAINWEVRAAAQNPIPVETAVFLASTLPPPPPRTEPLSRQDTLI